MDVSSPEEFIERPVVDIEVEMIGVPGLTLTLNYPADIKEPTDPEKGWLSFVVPEMNGKTVRFPARNIGFYSITRRMDLIPKDSVAGREYLEAQREAKSLVKRKK
jgi:hypothetical protein